MLPNLMTTRFNPETWKENKQAKEKYNLKSLYGADVPIKSMPNPTGMWVIDLYIDKQNDIKKIKGIGYITGKVVPLKGYIYSDNRYNFRIYGGNYYLKRKTLKRKNRILLSILERLLLYGKSHSCRGSGITSFPHKILKKSNFTHLIQQLRKCIGCHYTDTTLYKLTHYLLDLFKEIPGYEDHNPYQFKEIQTY